MSKETSKIRFLSLSRRSSLNDVVKNFIIQCSNHNNHEILAKFGEIKGYYSRMSINLPVACDCILEHGSSDYKFEEKVGRRQQSHLIERIIRANRESWLVAEKVGIDLFFEEKYSNGIFTIESNGDKSSFCELNLGEVVVYKPKSKVHYSITGISRSIVDQPKSDIPSSRCKKSVISWSFQRKLGNAYPFWDLKIINVVSSSERKRRREEHNDRYKELSEKNLDSYSKDENDDDEDDEYWMVVLSGNKQLISKHVELYNKGQINGLDRITNELIYNSSLIAKYLDEPISSNSTLYPSISYYYPNFFGDITTSIRAHYNMKKIQNADYSIIGGLRKYNNEVKRALIDQYFEKQLKYRQNKHLSVLDLACGHGQDILKYKGKRISRLIGIDISAEEISEARHRLKTYENSLNFSVEYHVGNLLSRTTYSKILKNYTFEMISIQLSMHYMLINEETSFEFLKNVSNYLKPGGFFIGSTISCDHIFYSMKNNSVKINLNDNSEDSNESNCGLNNSTKYVSGNSIYKISFNCDDWDKYFSDNIDLEKGIQLFRTEWGIKYDFWLIEHINQYEYVVPWESFCRLANKVGLELVQYSNFPNFIEFTQKNFPNIRLSNWLNNPKNSGLITQPENEVFSLYCVFAFKKNESSNINLEEQWSANDHQSSKNLTSGFKIKI
ncbi:Abd1p RNA guanine-7-methyltransferase [Cryptosporidium sp. chipmunk genotype I]|uniref:Abd1p RNA guanine-7-methyltransferase n=1 Tax=Cryptosporidium sp. chipmunk genotype I TaxID=1280935 RepID=UPI00351A9BBF|nr:Abd1p RNA guanine-7-methyltransferase [Cryptosporidium sp. chipmunk genotype I]